LASRAFSSARASGGEEIPDATRAAATDKAQALVATFCIIVDANEEEEEEEEDDDDDDDEAEVDNQLSSSSSSSFPKL
jgi:hypothetical protein